MMKELICGPLVSYAMNSLLVNLPLKRKKLSLPTKESAGTD